MIVVDASVAVRWIAKEDGWELAATLLDSDEMHAPDLILIEAGSAVARKVAAGLLTRAQAEEGLELVEERLTLHAATRVLVSRAVDLGLQLKHPIYDCVYIALAEELGANVATQDAALAKHIAQSGSVRLATGFELAK